MYSTEHIRQIEQAAYDTYKLSAKILMERAGKTAFQLAQSCWPKAKRYVVFCGHGNNGGDGYAFAYNAQKAGLKIKIRYLGDPNTLPDPALKQYQLCRKAKLDIKTFSASEDLSADVYIDALLGMGIQGHLRDDAKATIQYLNNSAVPILAIDVPSGLQADDGSVFDTAVKANCTITFIGVKRGLMTGRALDYCGELFLEDLALPQELLTQMPCDALGVRYNQIKMQLSNRRPKHTYKQEQGHALIIGGDVGMNGAVFLAALGAARMGSGLVTLGTRSAHASLITLKHPEILTAPIEEKRDLLPYIEKASVIVIGMGLGQKKWGKVLWQQVLSTDLPLIVDADALNLLAASPTKRANWILTPHPGEAATLLNCQAKHIEERRFQAAQQIQHKYGGLCILKGAGTIIQSKNGVPNVCCGGNPGMASAGMGDLLSGMIGGLVAQKFSLPSAAVLGVCIHAEAADRAAKQDGERGLLATDLLTHIRQLINP
jgi:NAD(P)H-hydrate epimerase